MPQLPSLMLQMADGPLKRAACGPCFFGPTEWAKQLSPCHMFGMVQLKVEPPAIVKGLKPKLHWVSWTKFEKDFFYKLA